MIKSDRRLYLTGDGSTVVEHGYERAAFLLVGKGCEIEASEAAKWGIVFPQPEPEAAPEPEQVPATEPKKKAK